MTRIIVIVIALITLNNVVGAFCRRTVAASAYILMHKCKKHLECNKCKQQFIYLMIINMWSLNSELIIFYLVTNEKIHIETKNLSRK